MSWCDSPLFQLTAGEKLDFLKRNSIAVLVDLVAQAIDTDIDDLCGHAIVGGEFILNGVGRGCIRMVKICQKARYKILVRDDELCRTLVSFPFQERVLLSLSIGQAIMRLFISMLR